MMPLVLKNQKTILGIYLKEFITLTFKTMKIYIVLVEENVLDTFDEKYVEHAGLSEKDAKKKFDEIDNLIKNHTTNLTKVEFQVWENGSQIK